MKLSRMFAMAVLAAGLTISVTSCTESKEQKTIDKMAALAEKVEEADNFAELDWDELTAEFQEIQQDAQECKFDKEQLKEFTRLGGKVMGGIMKQTMKGLPGIMKGVTEGAKGFAEGVAEGMDGIEESMEGIEKSMEGVEESMDELEKSMDELSGKFDR